MAVLREDWLRLTVEEPIEPQLPICDPHHHFWDRPAHEFRYSFEDVLRDVGSGHNIVTTLFVECREHYRTDGPQEMKPLGETEWVERMTAQSAGGHQGKTRIAAGIIGFAELTLGSAVAPVLEAQIAASKNRLRGIRYSSTWDPHPEIQSTTARVRPKGLLLDARFQEGFACLRKYGLVFDAFMYHPQLMDLVGLARAFTDTNIVLNHIGTVLAVGPYKGEDVFGEWKKSMTILAACPNVYVKLGGLGMHHFGFGWSEQARPPGSVQLAEEMKPYILTCIDLFGADRCMFESNFPPDKLSYSYNIMWNAFKRITRDYSAKERAALFHDTATRVYHIPPLEAAV